MAIINQACPTIGSSTSRLRSASCLSVCGVIGRSCEVAVRGRGWSLFYFFFLLFIMTSDNFCGPPVNSSCRWNGSFYSESRPFACLCVRACVYVQVRTCMLCPMAMFVSLCVFETDGARVFLQPLFRTRQTFGVYSPDLVWSPLHYLFFWGGWVREGL